LQGPHVGQIEVQLARGDNTFAVRYELRAGDPCVHVSITGTWVERGTREQGVPVLRLAMPFALREARGRYEIPFGAIDRAQHGGEEVPALRWAQIDGKLAGGKAGGCVVANDCKYGHSLDGSTLRVTLLRSSWDPDPIPEVNQHAMKFVLRPFGGTLPVAEAVRVGEELAQPLRAIGTDVHAGTLPTAAALMTVGPAHVVLAGLKRAEDGSGLVARVYDTSGKRSTVRIDVHALLGKPVRAQETDILERPLGVSTAKVSGRAVTVSLPAHGLATVKIALKRI
jgi:alpha-mannosidase